MQRHLARSDARRKQRQVVRTSGPGDELRNCVVREQHDFAASTQSIVHTLSLYCFDLGTYTYQNQAFGCHPSIWSKMNFSYKLRHRIKAELVIFLLHYSAGVDSTSTPRSSGGELNKVESLVGFGRWSSLQLD